MTAVLRVEGVRKAYGATVALAGVILDGRGWAGVAAPIGALLGMTLLFAVVALRRLRFDETRVGWT